MERNPARGMMMEQRDYDNGQYNSMETRDEGLGSGNQRFYEDPSGSLGTNMRPLDSNVSVGAKPVLNYSIQTGEEFALEFMWERVNPRQHFIQDPYNGPVTSGGYMDLRGILGASHTASEAASDISMASSVENYRPKDTEKKSPFINEDRYYYESVRSIPKPSSTNEINRTVRSHASFGTSDSASAKLKFLCSFGGKVLPRPSDGKLRYVGGETRIIRMSKKITWHELMQKALLIYNQTRTIKYQLPGEDLDALVSVSSDEDLQNMIEECSSLGDRGSQKPRMFLFSITDLDDAKFGLVNMEGDSEIQYVIAVNGMDLAPRKDPVELRTASENSLDELYSLKVMKDSNKAASVPAEPTPSKVSEPAIPLASSHSLLQTSSGFVVSSSQHNQVGLNHHQFSGPQEGLHYVERSAVPSSVMVQTPYSFYPAGHAATGDKVPANHVSSTEQPHSLGQSLHGGYPLSDAEVSMKEASLRRISSVQKVNEVEHLQSVEAEPTVEGKLKRDASQPKISQAEKVRHLESDLDGSRSCDNNAPYQIPKQESSAASSGMVVGVPTVIDPYQIPKPVNMSGPSEALPEGRRHVSSEIDPSHTTGTTHNSGSADAVVDQGESSHLETPVLPQRVYRSEWIPREQAEPRRLSKSDDSFSTQLLVPHLQTDHSQPMIESSDRVQDVNVAPKAELSVSAADPSRMKPENNVDANPGNYKEQISDNKKNSRVDEELQKVKGPKPEAEKFKAPDTANVDLPRVNEPTNQEDTSVGVGTSVHGDILIDINDRFPHDFLSDVFSMARDSQCLSGNSLLHADGTGMSLNMENREPTHWSFFRNLAQDDYSKKDVSLMDQDHPGFSSMYPHVGEKTSVSVDHRFPPPKPSSISKISQRDTSNNLRSDYRPSHAEGNEKVTFDDTENQHVAESEYQDGSKRGGNQNLSARFGDFSLGEFDISTLQIIKNDDLETIRELGSGTFGTVSHGKWRGTDVAIKRIKKSCFTGRSSEQERLTTEFWREADILSKLHHPNVVAFYGVVQDGPGGMLATVTEFMVNGSLRHVLLSKERQLDYRKRLIIAMDAAFGMEYLHSKNIVHFDLKCDNLLVNLKDPQRPICKVGDFGLSKIKRNTLVTGGVRGTLPWMAPELLNGSSSKVSEKVDVFSFGIVLWEILTGEEPYANMYYGAIIGGIVNNTLRPAVPSDCDSEWKLLMEQCWAPDPLARPSFTEITRRLRAMSEACQNKPPQKVAK